MFVSNTGRCMYINFAGAEFGLQLLLNIEEYQYVNFMEQIDSGIKVNRLNIVIHLFTIQFRVSQVHLHTQQEIPSVGSNGVGVSSGIHAMASVTYTTVSTWASSMISSSLFTFLC